VALTVIGALITCITVVLLHVRSPRILPGSSSRWSSSGRPTLRGRIARASGTIPGVRVDGKPMAAERPASRLDEHTAEILREIGEGLNGRALKAPWLLRPSYSKGESRWICDPSLETDESPFLGTQKTVSPAAGGSAY
jgi:hypothetical protein